MNVETIRLSESAKRQLISIKRRTGIDQWNTLCRWAFCISLAEKNRIGTHTSERSSNIEMTWKTFAGRHADMYEAIVRYSIIKCQSPEVSELEFVVGHIEHGLSRLSNVNEVSSIADLLGVAIDTSTKTR